VEQRRAAHQRAAEAVSRSAHALRLLAFTRAVLALPVPATHTADLAGWACTTLRARHAALRQEARRAQRMGPEGRHQLRIALKKLRYA
ncbi:CHAD domain-containing protein, partial [Pseudomonas sp. BGM005]|nr:CHAD domain-containing protein [Pseudomonas sp. BG5]